MVPSPVPHADLAQGVAGGSIDTVVVVAGVPGRLQGKRFDARHFPGFLGGPLGTLGILSVFLAPT